MQGYSFRQEIKNGKRHYDEKEMTYDGNALEIMKNDDGDITYHRVKNDDLLRMLGSHDSSLMERIEKDFKVALPNSKNGKKRTRKNKNKKKTTKKTTKKNTKKNTKKTQRKTQKNKK